MPHESSYDKAPIFSFTCDVGWAPERAIADTVDFFDEYSFGLTPFVTHDSDAIRRRFSPEQLSAQVGVQPNFFPQSTQGVNEKEVFETVRDLWPDARGFRSHGYFDSSHVALTARAEGFHWDSNLALILQDRLVPLEHFSGLVRFPVFWDDSVHLYKRLPFELSEIASLLGTPGLKVINVHPVHLALNTHSPEHYAESRRMSLDAGLFEGAGIRTFVTDLLDLVRDRGWRTAYLHDLFLEHEANAQLHRGLRDRGWAEAQRSGARATHDGGTTASYRAADGSQRATMVRKMYDQRDSRRVYATSPDTNLRELEIGFIREQVGEGRILDVGCGNGYTLISLASEIRAEMVGVDFSPAMIQGTQAIAAESGETIRGSLTFKQGDVRSLPFEDSSFDYVISERCLLNLPSQEDQWQTIREIHRILVDGGVYVMVEGTEDGLRRLNEARQVVGLEPIPSVSDDNFSSLKFDEQELEDFLSDLFDIEETRYFGAYYLISRVLQPLLALPHSPSFAAKLNVRARDIDSVVRDCGRLGHVVGYKLVARKP